jgi:hypothetical protein
VDLKGEGELTFDTSVGKVRQIVGVERFRPCGPVPEQPLEGPPYA